MEIGAAESAIVLSYSLHFRVLRTGGSYASAINSVDKGLAMDKENSVYMAKMFYTRALLNTK